MEGAQTKFSDNVLLHVTGRFRICQGGRALAPPPLPGPPLIHIYTIICIAIHLCRYVDIYPYIYISV